MPGEKYPAKKAYKFQVKILMGFCIPILQWESKRLIRLVVCIVSLHSEDFDGTVRHGVDQGHQSFLLFVHPRYDDCRGWS